MTRVPAHPPPSLPRPTLSQTSHRHRLLPAARHRYCRSDGPGRAGPGRDVCAEMQGTVWRRGGSPAARVRPLGVGEQGREERAGTAAGEVEEAAADGGLAVAHVEPVEGGRRAAAAGLVRHAGEGLDRLRRRQCAEQQLAEQRKLT
jgi:hypothetical protein